MKQLNSTLILNVKKRRDNQASIVLALFTWIFDACPSFLFFYSFKFCFLLNIFLLDYVNCSCAFKQSKPNFDCVLLDREYEFSCVTIGSGIAIIFIVIGNWFQIDLINLRLTSRLTSGSLLNSLKKYIDWKAAKNQYSQIK